MSEPAFAADYDDRGARAAHAVLVELGQVLGAHLDSIVIIGGTVPSLLLPDTGHIGSLDIDLDLNPEKLAEHGYAELVEKLAAAGYERNVAGLKAFQLRRMVDPDDGGEFALRHNLKMQIAGTMPDGRNKPVAMLVASIPALLVMKGYALVQRDKRKDAYDIYFCIRNYREGIAALAAECAKLIGAPKARQGFGNIASKFTRVDDFGPHTVRQFVEGSVAFAGMTPQQVQEDAYRQVSAFMKALGIVQ